MIWSVRFIFSLALKLLSITSNFWSSSFPVEGTSIKQVIILYGYKNCQNQITTADRKRENFTFSLMKKKKRNWKHIWMCWKPMSKAVLRNWAVFFLAVKTRRRIFRSIKRWTVQAPSLPFTTPQAQSERGWPQCPLSLHIGGWFF